MVPAQRRAYARLDAGAKQYKYALGVVTLVNSDISLNATSTNGPTFSHGNNRLFGNGAGDTPKLISQQ
jgi:hypothetical protein